MPYQNEIHLITDILGHIHGSIFEMSKLKASREMALEVIPPHSNHKLLTSYA